MKVVNLLAVRTIVLFLGIAFDVSAAAEYRILSECDASASVRANISKETQLQIHFAIAGATTCYSVTATVDGKEVRGYVLNAGLDSIAAFEKSRMKVSREALEAQQALPQPAAKIADPGMNATDGEKPAAAEKPAEPQKPVSPAPKAKAPADRPS